MPTSRPRYTIPETDEVARALDEPAQHWPDAVLTLDDRLARRARDLGYGWEGGDAPS